MDGPWERYVKVKYNRQIKKYFTFSLIFGIKNLKKILNPTRKRDQICYYQRRGCWTRELDEGGQT